MSQVFCVRGAGKRWPCPRCPYNREWHMDYPYDHMKVAQGAVQRGRFIKRIGLVTLYGLLAAGLALYLFTDPDKQGWAWKDGRAKSAFFLLTVSGVACLAVRIRKLVEAGTTARPLLIAILLGAAPLALGLFFFALALLWMDAGLFNILIELIAFPATALGVVMLLFHTATCRRWSQLQPLRLALALLILALNLVGNVCLVTRLVFPE